MAQAAAVGDGWGQVAGGGPIRHKTSRTVSSSLKTRTTVKQLKVKKDEPLLKSPIHVKIICMVDVDDSPGEFDEVDFNIGEISVETFPRYINRRAAVLADATGCMRAFFYVNTGYEAGDCIRISNYGLRMMRIVIHRKTSVEFNIPITIPQHVLDEANRILGTNYYPYLTLKQIDAKHPFARASVLNARISRVSENRGDQNQVIELYLDDNSKRMYVSVWRKAAALDYKVNQAVTIHDVIGKESNFHHVMALNVNFKDEISLGCMLPEIVTGEVEGCNDSAREGELELLITDGLDQYATSVPRAMLLEALFLENDATDDEILATLPVYIRITMDLEDRVQAVEVLEEKP